MANIQVMHDKNLNNARNESNVAINPNNLLQVVSASESCRYPEVRLHTRPAVFKRRGLHLP
jgi:hypothetical protein